MSGARKGCPRNLFARVWIKCWRMAVGTVSRGLQGFDQKTASEAYSQPEPRAEDAARFCPQSLLAGLWIICSVAAECPVGRGLYEYDQKMIDSSFKLTDPFKSEVWAGYAQGDESMFIAYAQTLLVSLWIRCMESATAQQTWCFGRFGQKMISDLPDIYASRKTPQPALRYPHPSKTVDNS